MTYRQTPESKAITDPASYDVIYADPPWSYNFSRSESRKVENHYPTMTLDEIKKLSIPAEDNAVLYLWATSPKLPEALEVMTAWGFAYKISGSSRERWLSISPGTGNVLCERPLPARQHGNGCGSRHAFYWS